MRLIVTPRNEVPVVTVFWGATGVGKSRRARRVTPGDDLHICTRSPPGLTRTTDIFRFCLKSSAVSSALISFSHSQTVITAEFNLKEARVSSWRRRSTSPLLCIQATGIQNWTYGDSFSQLERRLTHVIDFNVIAEEERAKRVCLVLESGEGFVDVEEDQKATKIVDLAVGIQFDFRVGQPRCLLCSGSFSVDSASHTRWFSSCVLFLVMVIASSTYSVRVWTTVSVPVCFVSWWWHMSVRIPRRSGRVRAITCRSRRFRETGKVIHRTHGSSG